MAKAKKPASELEAKTGSFCDEAQKQAMQRRLKRVEGQVRGLQAMIEDNRYCMDVLTQIAATREGLRAVGDAVIRSHLQHCVKNACAAGGDQPDEIIDELLSVLKRYR